jgi:hypothetical protein
VPGVQLFERVDWVRLGWIRDGHVLQFSDHQRLWDYWKSHHRPDMNMKDLQLTILNQEIQPYSCYVMISAVVRAKLLWRGLRLGDLVLPRRRDLSSSSSLV